MLDCSIYSSSIFDRYLKIVMTNPTICFVFGSAFSIVSVGAQQLLELFCGNDVHDKCAGSTGLSKCAILGFLNGSYSIGGDYRNNRITFFEASEF